MVENKQSKEFNPNDYRTHEELPEDKRDNFVPVGGGGFIRNETAKNDESSKKIANIINSKRPILDKIFGKNKTSNVDLDRESAVGENIEFNRIKQEKKRAIEDQINKTRIEKLFVTFRETYPTFKEFLDNKNFAHFISSSKGLKIITLTRNSKEYMDLINTKPCEHSHGFQYAFVSYSNMSRRIFYLSRDRVEDIDVKRESHFFEDHAGYLPNEEEDIDGETVSDVLNRLGLNNKKIVIAAHDVFSAYGHNNDTDVAKLFLIE